ncbi:flavin reductase family protein [Adhaeribacter soli]|uniref:Flavin reductase family protein n=1 Tax=Adhaeribacter soli TaxID=2607655 RepID=A0A5N1IJU9_9BACT|nr:flavin reductase family protein [Adhaeribacter soli]KAA9326022.1 flavin reductase family protein [Adhaeribacter soli]
MIKTIDPKAIPTAEFHAYMLGAVAPRPIAFASTVDEEGNVNLSPFSFFNAFGSNPPILIFSPARRVRDNTIKHTLENAYATKEVVINIGNYDIVEQLSLASTEYDKGINEFIKSGLTPAPSVMVKPPRVAEAPAAFECRVRDIIPLGDQGGAANLIVCEVLLMHLNENVLGPDGKTIDPNKLDAVARLGGDWYLRASGDCLFELPKPVRNKGIGVDQLPEHIRTSNRLTGNNLARLGNTEKEQVPTAKDTEAFKTDPLVEKILSGYKHDRTALKEQLETLGIRLLNDNKVTEAWKVLLMAEGL